MAHVRVELTVALHDFGQPRRIVVQCLGQLPHFVVGKTRREWLGMAAAATIGLQARGEIGHRPHHPRSRPPPQHPGQQAEHQHRKEERALELLLATHGLAHVVGDEEPGVGRLAHSDLVGERLAIGILTAEIVDAVLQVLPLGVIATQPLQFVRAIQERAHLLHRRHHVPATALDIALPGCIQVAVHHVFDQLVLHPGARPVGGEGEQCRQAEAQQHERDDDAAAQAAAIPPLLADDRRRRIFRHRVRRSGIQCRDGSGSSAR